MFCLHKNHIRSLKIESTFSVLFEFSKSSFIFFITWFSLNQLNKILLIHFFNFKKDIEIFFKMF